MEEAEFRQRILRILESIDARLAKLEQSLEGNAESRFKAPEKKKAPLDVDALLSLPDHLRKSALAVSTIGSATADEVSKETGRSRAAESDYLNQLVKMGYLSKDRKGRTIYFKI